MQTKQERLTPFLLFRVSKKLANVKTQNSVTGLATKPSLGVLQSAANLAIPMLAGGKHTIV